MVTGAHAITKPKEQRSIRMSQFIGICQPSKTPRLAKALEIGGNLFVQVSRA